MIVARTLAAVALSSVALCAPAAGNAQEGVHFILSGGLTTGGDKIASVQFTNGDTTNIHAGDLIQIGGGALWQFRAPVALALTANYQTAGIAARNGDVTFDRYPLEALLYYTGEKRWRFGGGVRYVESPRYKDYVYREGNNRIEFKNATGAVAEIGYGLSDHAWLNVRYVSERYKPESITSNGVTSWNGNFDSVDGSHVGINFLYQF